MSSDSSTVGETIAVGWIVNVMDSVISSENQARWGAIPHGIRESKTSEPSDSERPVLALPPRLMQRPRFRVSMNSGLVTAKIETGKHIQKPYLSSRRVVFPLDICAV